MFRISWLMWSRRALEAPLVDRWETMVAERREAGAREGKVLSAVTRWKIPPKSSSSGAQIKRRKKILVRRTCCQVSSPFSLLDCTKKKRGSYRNSSSEMLQRVCVCVCVCAISDPSGPVHSVRGF